MSLLAKSDRARRPKKPHEAIERETTTPGRSKGKTWVLHLILSTRCKFSGRRWTERPPHKGFERGLSEQVHERQLTRHLLSANAYTSESSHTSDQRKSE